MKWVRYSLLTLAAVVVCAVLVLLFLGSRPGAGDLNTSIQISRPPSAVWPWIREPEKLKSWVSWLVEVRSQEADRERVGGREVWVMEDRNNNNEKMEIASEVIDVQPGKLLAVKLLVAGAFNGRATYRLTDAGSGTKLEVESHYDFGMWFAKLMSPVIMPAARKKMNGDLAKLKELVEQHN